MRIALIIEQMKPLRGGREISITEIATTLARRHCEVTILCQTASWRGEGVKIRMLGSRGWSRLERLRNFVQDVQRIIKLQRFDIVHTTLPLPGANVYQLRSGTMPGQRAASLRRRLEPARTLSAVGRSLNFCRRYLARMERQFVGRNDVVCLAVSEMVKAELRTHYGQRGRVRLVYNAVDVPEYDSADMAEQRKRYREELGLAPHDTLFITLARNFKLKGVAETLRAFARWHEGLSVAASGRLVVIGGEKPAAYQELARRLGVDHLTTFVTPTRQVRGWYAAADACVLLSWYDPCSRVILEATRFGVPSITTIFNGASEMLRSGAGIVVDSPRNVEAVASAMDQLSDREERRPFREACLRVASQLSTEHHVDQLLDIYAEILSSRMTSPALPLRGVATRDPSRALPPATQEGAVISVTETARPYKKAA